VDQADDYTTEDGLTVVTVTGEIDVYSAPALREKLVALIERGQVFLIVDLERVRFLDSTGLGVLIGGLRRVRARDGFLDLVCTQPRMLRIFQITGLTKIFTIFNSVEDALQHHRPQPGPN
jgi:anti-sigma B factor antagonist